MSKGIGWGHLGNYKNYRVVGAKKEQTPPSIEERQQQVFNKFNKSWEYDPEKLKPYSGWLGAPLQTGSTSPTPTPSVTPTMTPTPSATPTPQFSPSGITGLQLWFDADDTSTMSLSGNYVESWTSKGSTPLVLTATTSVRQPEYITTGGTGSSSALLFFSSSTSANRSLLTQVDLSQSFNLTSGHTIFIANKNIGNKTSAGLYGTSIMYLYNYGVSSVYGNQSLQTLNIPRQIDYLKTGATTGMGLMNNEIPGCNNSGYTSASPYQITGYYSDYSDLTPTNFGGQDLFSGSTAFVSLTSATTLTFTGKTINGMGIGGHNHVGTPTGTLTQPQEYYEILVYNRKLSTIEFNNVMNYLKGKWDYTTDLSNLAVIDVNYTGKTNNNTDLYRLRLNNPSANTIIGNNYWGGNGVKWIIPVNNDIFWDASFPTLNTGVNLLFTDASGNTIDSATCRKTGSSYYTLSAGTYNFTGNIDYNCIDPSPSPTPTLTLTPSPTLTLTPTYTPSPTMTPTPSY